MARLAADGLNACAIARDTGIPRTTVRGWLDGSVGRPRPRPDPSRVPPASYAYLLGIYLGDGYLAAAPKGLWDLRIYCDAAYPRIVSDITAAIHDVRGMNTRVRRILRPNSRCLVVQNLWKHWPLLIPQHGPGMKHTRKIELADWQRDITHAEPEAFIRGLIHSDGCRFIARQPCRGKVYAYVRYSFKNESEDIKNLYREHLQLLGIRWVTPNLHQVDVNRRADVDRMEAFIGPKM